MRVRLQRPGALLYSVCAQVNLLQRCEAPKEPLVQHTRRALLRPSPPLRRPHLRLAVYPMAAALRTGPLLAQQRPQAAGPGVRCSAAPVQRAAVQIAPREQQGLGKLAAGLLGAAAALSLALSPPALAAEPFLKSTGACACSIDLSTFSIALCSIQALHCRLLGRRTLLCDALPPPVPCKCCLAIAAAACPLSVCHLRCRCPRAAG